MIEVGLSITGGSEEEEDNNPNSAFQGLDEEGRQRIDINKIQDNADFYGDKITKNKHKDILQVGFININGLPSFNEHMKNERIFAALKDNSFDVIGMAEINKNWGRIDLEQSWRSRMQPWWESSKTVQLYNIQDCGQSDFQPGGTITHSINRCTHKIRTSGTDPTGLGRWSWIRFQGSHNITLTIITAYQPCKPSWATGVNTNYVQQIRYFDELEEDRDPRQALLQDLGKFIIECHNNNDQIVLMMDANEEVSTPSFSNWVQQHGLEDLITRDRDDVIPPTYHRGSKQIDGIFASATIHAVRSGFMEFGGFPSDHRALWFDMTYNNAFGCRMATTMTYAPRRLKSNDPKVQKRWIELMNEHIKTHKLDKRLKAIEDQMHSPLTPQLLAEYDNIVKIQNEG